MSNMDIGAHQTTGIDIGAHQEAAISSTQFLTREARAGVLGVARPYMRTLEPIATPDQEWRMNAGNAWGGNALDAVAGGRIMSSLANGGGLAGKGGIAGPKGGLAG